MVLDYRTVTVFALNRVCKIKFVYSNSRFYIYLRFSVRKLDCDKSEADLKHLINVHCLNLAFINYTVIIRVLLLNFPYLTDVKCQVTKGGWTPRATLYIAALKARWQPLKTISLAVLVLPSKLRGFIYSLASCVPTPPL